eukprot:scaffold41444_cov57-Phaeocystis_antarctica.AAC.1
MIVIRVVSVRHEILQGRPESLTPPRYEAGGQGGGHPRGPPAWRGRAGGCGGGVEAQPAYRQLAREARDVLELRPG